MKKIAVVGSINYDFFIETSVLPKIGETVSGNNFFTSLGGKGLNQAIAASRAGGAVSLFASLGDDDIGRSILEKLQKENINLNYIQKSSNAPTGVAFIHLCHGDNSITIISGANAETNSGYIDEFKEQLLEHDIFLFQLETPIEMLKYIIPVLYQHKKIIIVDPAPARKLDSDLIEKITYLLPNEHEFSALFNSNESLKTLLEKYPKKLIVTQGSNGVAFYDGNKIVHVPSIKVPVVDTTGAGDTFAGAFAAAIASDMNLYKSIKIGNVAGGISVTQKGAQAGMPYQEEIKKYLKNKD